MDHLVGRCVIAIRMITQNAIIFNSRSTTDDRNYFSINQTVGGYFSLLAIRILDNTANTPDASSSSSSSSA